MAYLPRFLLLLLMSLLSPVPSTSKDVVDDFYLLQLICSHTYDYTYCQNAFISDPRSLTADLPTFGTISLDLTSQKIKGTLDYIDELGSNSTDALFKIKLSVCRLTYLNVLHLFLPKAYQGLAEKNYGRMGLESDLSIIQVSACRDGFVLIKSPLMTEPNEDMFRLCNIINATATVLMDHP